MIVEIKPERAIELIERMSKFIVERKMAPAAIMFIESVKPLNFIASQLLYFIGPFAELIFNAKEYQEFAAMLEKDEYIEMFLKRIDQLDTEMHQEERAKNKLLRKRRMNKIKNFFNKIFKK